MEAIIGRAAEKKVFSSWFVSHEPRRWKKTIFPTMITTYGTKQNNYYTGRILGEAVMEDLFAS